MHVGDYRRKFRFLKETQQDSLQDYAHAATLAPMRAGW